MLGSRYIKCITESVVSADLQDTDTAKKAIPQIPIYIGISLPGGQPSDDGPTIMHSSF